MFAFRVKMDSPMHLVSQDKRLSLPANGLFELGNDQFKRYRVIPEKAVGIPLQD
jgi:hypothetical protein